jgi:hypothetical protein
MPISSAFSRSRRATAAESGWGGRRVVDGLVAVPRSRPGKGSAVVLAALVRVLVPFVVSCWISDVGSRL